MPLDFFKSCLCPHLNNGLRPAVGGRRAANEEEQHDVIPAPLCRNQERGGAECPCGGPDRALLRGGRHRGQVGLVDGSAVWSATACFSEDEINEGSIWDFGSEYAISTERWGRGGGGTSLDSVSFTVCLEKPLKKNQKMMFEQKNVKRIERLTNKSTVTGLASL